MAVDRAAPLRAAFTGFRPDLDTAVPPHRVDDVGSGSCLDVRRSVAELGLDRPVPLIEGLRCTLGWIRSR